MALSWTKIDTLRRCPLAYRRRYIERRPGPTSAPREVGTAAHEVAEHIGRDGLTEEQAYRLLARKAALLEDEAAADLRAVMGRAIDMGWLPGFPSDAQDHGYELRFALDEFEQPCEWADPKALFRGIIDQVFRENGGELVVIRDWKSGRVIEAPGDQARYYAWAMSCLFPEVEEVLAEFHYLRFGAVRKSDVFGADALRAVVPQELLAVREDLERRIRDNNWTPRVSTSCRNCDYRTSCPQFAQPPAPLVILETEDLAKQAANDLVVLRRMAEDCEEALRAWVAQHGPLDLEEEELGLFPEQRTTVTDVHATVKALLSAQVENRDIWKHLKISRADAEKLVAARAPRGTKKEAKETFTARLLEEGAARRETSMKFTRKRKSEESNVEAE